MARRASLVRSSWTFGALGARSRGCRRTFYAVSFQPPSEVVQPGTGESRGRRWPQVVPVLQVSCSLCLQEFALCLESRSHAFERGPRPPPCHSRSSLHTLVTVPRDPLQARGRHVRPVTGAREAGQNGGLWSGQQNNSS